MGKEKEEKNTRYTEEELSVLLNEITTDLELVLAPQTAANTHEKTLVWGRVTHSINSISSVKREAGHVRKKFSDWVYNLKNTNRKKNLKDTDKRLLKLLKIEMKIKMKMMPNKKLNHLFWKMRKGC